jgi:hypothetical protein
MLGIHASGSHLRASICSHLHQAHTVPHAFGQMRQITSIIPRHPERPRRADRSSGGVRWPYWMEDLRRVRQARGRGRC